MAVLRNPRALRRCSRDFATSEGSFTIIHFNNILSMLSSTDILLILKRAKQFECHFLSL